MSEEYYIKSILIGTCVATVPILITRYGSALYNYRNIGIAMVVNNFSHFVHVLLYKMKGKVKTTLQFL